MKHLSEEKQAKVKQMLERIRQHENSRCRGEIKHEAREGR